MSGITSRWYSGATDAESRRLEKLADQLLLEDAKAQGHTWGKAKRGGLARYAADIGIITDAGAQTILKRERVGFSDAGMSNVLNEQQECCKVGGFHEHESTTAREAWESGSGARAIKPWEQQ